MSNPWRELLPLTVEVCGKEYEIRSDYRAVLDILAALSDASLDEQGRGLVVLDIFYPGFEEMPPEHYQEAIERCFWFVNCGEEDPQRKATKLMDWEMDFPRIVSPINRVLGLEVRGAEYLHWYTFMAAYQEIGDCTFAQIVKIRSQLAKGKSLDKSDREWYRQNRHLVDFKTKYTEHEDTVLSAWGVK